MTISDFPVNTLLILLFTFSACIAQSDDQIERVVLDPSDAQYGYYLASRPKGKIQSVLILLAGSGQAPEDIFLDTQFDELCVDHNILVIAYAGRFKLTADLEIQKRLNKVVRHIYETTEISADRYILGGFSAGGNIALRYTELCHQYPDRFLIKPSAVFMADSPIDLYHLWSLSKSVIDKNFSEVSVSEARWIQSYFVNEYGGTPDELPEVYRDLTPFSIEPSRCTNEQYLAEVAVRAYHDIDVSWRLSNRRQTPQYDNFIATAELINRLRILGNDQAEFIQTFQTGYRRDGRRHPHSWSIVDENECIDWIESLFTD